MDSEERKKRQREIPMDWRLIRFDETQYYNEEFLKKYKIEACYSYYIYDKNRHVHICEITPSYELWKVGQDFKGSEDLDDDEREETWEAFDEANRDDEDVTYNHVSNIDRIDAACGGRSCNMPGFIADKDIEHQYEDDDEPAYRQSAEELREYYSGNHPGW